MDERQPRLKVDRDAGARLAAATAAVRRVLADPDFAKQMAAARRIMDAHRNALGKLAD